jgi:hypothetical protein
MERPKTLDIVFKELRLYLRRLKFKIFFFCSTEVWALRWLGRCSTTLSTLLALFALVIFKIRLHISVPDCLDYNPPIYASCVAGMTGMYHHAQLFIG